MTSQGTGSDGQHVTIGTGEFYCADCTSRQAYELKGKPQPKKSWLARLFASAEQGQFVEGQKCGSTFVPEVLQTADESHDVEYLKGIRRVAIQMMAVDGSIDDEEVAAIQEMYQQVTGQDLDDASIRREAANISDRSDQDLSDFLTALATRIDDRGKELILKTAFWVVGADKQFDEEEANLIYRVGGALGISAADVRVLMDRMSVSKG